MPAAYFERIDFGTHATVQQHVVVSKDKSNKAENGKGIEGALGPGGLRGRVFGAAHGETEGFNSRSWGPPGQTSASRTSAVDLLDAVRQPARGSEGWAVVGGRMIREGS
jgi:hypothetical protein